MLNSRNVNIWKMKPERHRIYEDCHCLTACSSTCEVVEEVEGEGEAGGLSVEQGRLRMT